MKKLSVMLAAVLLLALLSGCAFTDKLGQIDLPEPPGTEKETAAPTPDPAEAAAEQARQEALNARRAEAIARAEELRQQYFYDEAIAALSDEEIVNEQVEAALAAIRAEKDSLVDYTGDVPHIFFHSLIVYPELVFTDRVTPMGGYNSGFSEKAELEKILPQLYERGYVLYDLDALWEMTDSGMQRNPILLPPGKTPLILSVDDVAYAYGDGFAQQLFVDENGELMYRVNNPQGGVDIVPDGDVMGVVDAFVEQHPDFSYRGHKGTIALTGFQGAFGYDYDIPEQAEQIRTVSAALKADGWNFASHSYTHNRVNNYYGPGCSVEKISYDINKWVDHVVPCIGETRLFIAPFGYRVQQPALQCILDAGFQIYCTVDSKVYNELNPDYALMSRIEIGGYSMTYYRDTLNELFFDVDSVFDAAGRPPVVG